MTARTVTDAIAWAWRVAAHKQVRGDVLELSQPDLRMILDDHRRLQRIAEAASDLVDDARGLRIVTNGRTEVNDRKLVALAVALDRRSDG